MALNPISYTENVIRSFLRFLVTSYPLADQRLHEQLRELLSLDSTRDTPLLKGPYITLSRSFRMGATVDSLVSDGLLHPHLRQLIEFPNVYDHQERAIRAIQGGQSTLVSTGTGSGKTECFLYPVISRCLELRDDDVGPGISAVLVYPMNALAEDQLQRLRELLAGSGISFGMYVGKTPERQTEVTNQMPEGTTRQAYLERLAEERDAGTGFAIHPPEEVCSREMMREPGKQPRILLTNVKQLELLLTRQRDIQMFDNALLDFLVFDEAHTFTGVQGAETACLIRRLRTFCGKAPDETVCVATSATIVDETNPDAAREFASRFFGVDENAIATVSESYEEDDWDPDRSWPAAFQNPSEALEHARIAVDDNPPENIGRFWRRHLGSGFPSGGNWDEVLFDELAGNELLFQLSQLLENPRQLSDCAEALSDIANREVTEEEMLTWLVLGAAARRGGRALVRPVVHAFLRGIQGAVVTFDGTSNEATLHLAAEDDEIDSPRMRLRTSTCATCGQHYFETRLGDFDFTGPAPDGGQASNEGVYWEPLGEAEGGTRVLLIDRLISDDDDEDSTENHQRLHPLYFCRHCGTAHEEERDRCLQCGNNDPLVHLHAVKQRENRVGRLHSCVGCKAPGAIVQGRFHEPNKPIRAANVHDVHVLAQDMIHRAERKRLLVFADNRQDAAFQAGWMRDHARRFKFRALLHEQLHTTPAAMGDVVVRLDEIFEDDPTLSVDVLPEVWASFNIHAAPVEHRRRRRELVRILVLQELTAGPKQLHMMEPMGRMFVDYEALSETSPFFESWSNRLGISPPQLLENVKALLDLTRRRRLLHDSEGRIFGRYINEGDPELTNGFLSTTVPPKGIKLRRAAEDDERNITQWISDGYQTTFSLMAETWGVPRDDVPQFLEELWDCLRSPEVNLIVPVRITGSRDRVVAGTGGSHQLNGDLIRIQRNESGTYQCGTCGRRTIRHSHNFRCLAWRCDGTVRLINEDADNYELQLIDQEYSFLRPREHTAMVPAPERERIEEKFKGQGEEINTLVCTQTLEMGVDIGSLDSVLMRNVPPLPANYWQRAGRAGRRHRMAVNLTYCRPVSHDRSYFREPERLLGGRVDPPSFNLSNSLMIQKHVNASVLTTLSQMARDENALSEDDRREILTVLSDMFPRTITPWFFEEERVRQELFDITPLRRLIQKHRAQIESAVLNIFRNGWPATDQLAVSEDVLRGYVNQFDPQVLEVIQRIFRRLRWAMGQMARLDVVRREHGDLNDEEQAFYNRCQKYVRRIKGRLQAQRGQAQGFDDTNTFSVLAAEGFLPGYGLETGSVVGMAEVPRQIHGLEDFDLPRPKTIAVREYVPGNLIYANGQRFVPRQFVRQLDHDDEPERLRRIHPETETIEPVEGAGGGGAGDHIISAIPVTDAILTHLSRISDEEDNRFQMGVSIYGRDLGQHNGGRVFHWGTHSLLFKKNARIELVNVGPTSAISANNNYGYPVCTVCGQSVSPFASTLQIENFQERHRRCGQTPGNIGFFTEINVDALLIPECSSKSEAYSLAESIRFAAVDLLDMTHEDLQILVNGRTGEQSFDAYVYDPMPGGSGLLEQILERYDEIGNTALTQASGCPSLCESSCIDCYQLYRNAFYHPNLDRHLIVQRWTDLGNGIQEAHEIPPSHPNEASADDGAPVINSERALRDMLERAGFPQGRWQENRTLDRAHGTTTPDVTFDDPDDDDIKVFVYLDGLSEHIHGNPETQAQDNLIRQTLRGQGHEVIEITVHDLGDRNAMARHFRRLARSLLGSAEARQIADQSDAWFVGELEQDEMSVDSNLTVVENIQPDEAYVTYVPIYDLAAAAGAFSEDQVPEQIGWATWPEHRSFQQGMFVGQIVGQSMEPQIPDASWALFQINPAGSRHGRVLLVQSNELHDPDTGGNYTVKRYGRPPQDVPEGDVRSGVVQLIPNNPDYNVLEIEDTEESPVRVLAEFIEVIG